MSSRNEAHDVMVALLVVQTLMERRSEIFFQPFGITGAQFNILNLLAHRGGRMEQASLVELLLVGKSSVSVVLNRMVRDGLVARGEHPNDRRQVVLILTVKGRLLWRKISPRYEAGVSRIFGAMPPVGRKRLREELKRLHAILLAENGDAQADEGWDSHFSSVPPT